MRIFFASSKILLVEAITALLKDKDFYEVCGTQQTLGDGEQLSNCRPGDVIVLTDPSYDCSTVHVLQKIRTVSNGASIVIISCSDDLSSLASLFDNSVNAILTKESSIHELHAALKVAASGARFLPPAMASALAANVCDREFRQPRLSPREMQIIYFIARGVTNKKIAKLLSLSAKTVSCHKSSIKHRLSLRGTSEIVLYAIEHNLLARSSF
jgi:two-component system nitrate/nitrite response regulator NarL